MLKLILGKAGTGKTARITGEIRELIASGKNNIYLVVPEQFSHEAERELCRVCGDSLSLHAEVLSFTSLARKVRMQVGGIAEQFLDKGGKLLCMGLAMQTVSEKLTVFRDAALRPDFQSMLLTVSDGMKLAGITADDMRNASFLCGGELAGKLRDLASVTDAYNSVVSKGHADPADALSLLAKQIPKSRMTEGCTYFIDGFVDFTGMERKILEILMASGADLTVCLTVDDLQGTNEIFSLSRISANLLLKKAEELGIPAEVRKEESGSSSPAAMLAENIFSYVDGKKADTDFFTLCCAESAAAECEFAASRVRELVREKNYRWRDIAIAIRGFEDYRAVLERTFERYEVPLFTAGTTPLPGKPLACLISAAYEITENGWRPDDMIAYLETGLSGLTLPEADLLSGYIYKWQLYENAWMSGTDWLQHPDGYGKPFTDDAKERLERINALRRKVCGPLQSFKIRNGRASAAAEYAKSLAEFLADADIPGQLARKSEAAVKAGKRSIAMENSRLWGIITGALEQIASLAGDMRLETKTFADLFALMLSNYAIGTIPASLDRVSAGDFTRMRRRNIKHLIILGAEDSRLPGPEPEDGIFTADEKERLELAGIQTGAGSAAELWREFTLVYNCISLPSEGMTVVCPQFGISGDSVRRSVVITQAEKLFGLETKRISMEDVRVSALSPAVSLALQSENGAGSAARKYFSENMPGLLEDLHSRAEIRRGALSPLGVSRLYGEHLHISASRAESFFSCKYGFFCRYGMKAEPYTPAVFTPAEIGTFVHYVLENTVRAIAGEGGFHTVTEERARELTDSFIQRYITEELNDFAEKTERFIYIFRRICEDVRTITLDTLGELKKSEFVPMAFELNFGGKSLFHPIQLNGGKDSISLSGIADRIDGWEHDGKVYLRVVDYKTGKKKFSAEDIYYGRNMQMILYLYSLNSDRKASAGTLAFPEGTEFVPAGVMYLPARDEYVSATGRSDAANAEKKRIDGRRRSGIVLNEDGVPEAWESGEEKIYIPDKSGRGKTEEKALVSAEEIDTLFRHVRARMSEMTKSLRSGAIEADPYQTSGRATPCDYCEYKGKCGFGDGENNESVRILPKLTPETAWEKMKEEDSGDE